MTLDHSCGQDLAGVNYAATRQYESKSGTDARSRWNAGGPRSRYRMVIREAWG